MCEGVMAIKGMRHEDALSFFARATGIFPGNKEPYIYRLLAYISLYLSRDHNSEYEKAFFRTKNNRKKTIIKWAEEELAMAISKAKKDAELYYYRGIIQLSQRRYAESMKSISKARIATLLARVGNKVRGRECGKTLFRQRTLRGLCEYV